MAFISYYIDLDYFVIDKCSRPWLCYWIIHSITLMGESVNSELEDNVVQFLSHCEV